MSVQKLGCLILQEVFVQVLVGYISSITTSMEFAAINSAAIINLTALVDPRTLLFSVTSMLDSRKVIVHSFIRFEISKFKLCNGPKVKMEYSPHSATSSIKRSPSANDFQGAREDYFNATLI